MVVAGIADIDFPLGIFGPDPAPSNLTTFENEYPSFVQTLVTNQIIPSTSWAYTAGAAYSILRLSLFLALN
jgi:hypothetical protein